MYVSVAFMVRCTITSAAVPRAWSRPSQPSRICNTPQASTLYANAVNVVEMEVEMCPESIVTAARQDVYCRLQAA